MTTGAQLSRAESELLAQRELSGHFFQSFPAHQAGPQSTERALVRFGMGCIQSLCHYQAEQRITEKLQPLIVWAGHAAVG